MQPPSPHPATRLSVSAQIFAFNLFFNYFFVILILGVHAIFLIFLSTSTIHQALGSIFQIVRWVHPPLPPEVYPNSKCTIRNMSLTSLHRSGSCTRFYPKYHEQHRYLHASNLSFIDANILNIGQYFIIFSNFKVYWILRYYSHRKMIYSINNNLHIFKIHCQFFYLLAIKEKQFVLNIKKSGN